MGRYRSRFIAVDINSGEVLTVANGMSIGGAGVIVCGSTRLDTWVGIAEVVTGEIVDLLDGPVARARGETSQFSAGVDAGMDKVKALAVLVAEWKNRLAPRASLAFIAGHNILNSAVTIIGMRNHPEKEFSPTSDGKKSMFLENTAMILYPVAAKLEQTRLHHYGSVVRYAGHAATALGVGYFGMQSTASYFQRARKNHG